jgi:hypothetical protein
MMSERVMWVWVVVAVVVFSFLGFCLSQVVESMGRYS